MSKGKGMRRGRCALCGGSGMSKEPIWSDWLKAILPRVGTNSQTRIGMFYNQATNVALIVPTPTIVKQGDLHARKVRKVCKRCNSGWMSGIVGRAKPWAELLLTVGIANL